jgi:hypothetical protein
MHILASSFAGTYCINRQIEIDLRTKSRGVVLLHVSFNRLRFKDKDMQQIKVLQRPLRV